MKAFYTAGMIYDVLTTFGELTDEAAQNRKYAKWKAAYIHNCLKNGETPVPGKTSLFVNYNKKYVFRTFLLTFAFYIFNFSTTIFCRSNVRGWHTRQCRV